MTDRNNKPLRKPVWLKSKLPDGTDYRAIKEILDQKGLHTICQSGHCPNLGECWGRGTATLLILGDICTRSCKFCATKTGKPLPVDNTEPVKAANLVKDLHLTHVVLTSVDRDDLPDGGAAAWVAVIREIRRINPGTTIETLIPDFGGKKENIQQVINEQPEIISHNLETVRRLTPLVRSSAQYERSLKVLHQISQEGVVAKSGIMVGLGETPEEVFSLMDDLRMAGCQILTVGQYLQPTLDHFPVSVYITPEQFEIYRAAGLKKGFSCVESGPLIRSSYHAEQQVSC